MCGIYGFIGKPDNETPLILSKLGILNESRGSDSAGVAFQNEKGGRLLKHAINPTTFILTPRIQTAIYNACNSKNLTYIGHTRAATHGAVNNENSHPYQINGIVYVHNGIISNFDKLQKVYKTKYQVDSQIIGHVLDRKNPKKAFETILAGSMAVPFFYFKELGVLRIVNRVSPTAYAYTKDQKGVYFTSLLYQLNHLVTEFNLLPAVDIETLTLTRFVNNGKTVNMTSEKLTLSVKQKYLDPPPVYVAPQYPQNYNSEGYWLGWDSYKRPWYNPQTSNKPSKETKKLNNQRFQNLSIDDGFGGVIGKRNGHLTYIPDVIPAMPEFNPLIPATLN